MWESSAGRRCEPRVLDGKDTMRPISSYLGATAHRSQGHIHAAAEGMLHRVTAIDRSIDRWIHLDEWTSPTTLFLDDEGRARSIGGRDRIREIVSPLVYSGAPKIALFVGRVSSSSHRSLPTSTLGLPLTAFFVSFVASCPTMVLAIVVCINSIEVCGGVALLPFLSKEQPSSNEAIDNRLGEDWLRRERMELADILLVDGACRLWTTLPTACSGNASILYPSRLHRKL